ncbi:MAG: heavy-metal-associated domain-containing protein [Ferruginibacter sp.]
MKKIFSVLFLFVMVQVQGQVKNVMLQASGLTCSMCSNSINKALKTIDYIQSVRANIQTSSFNITFKEGAKVNFDDLKMKVEDAGFSVANLTATINFDNAAIANDEHLDINGMIFHFMNVKEQVLSGSKSIRILDKGYVTMKEYKKNEKFTKKECYKTGTAGTGSCCSKSGLAAGTRIYHVTI